MSSKLLQILIALLLNCTFILAQNKADDNTKYFLNKADELIQKKEYKEAIVAYEDAETICPTCQSPHFKKAMLYGDLKEFVKADKEMKIAYKLNPANTNNIWYGALLKSKKELFEQALQDVQNHISKLTNEQSIKEWNRLKNIITNNQLAYKEKKIAHIVSKAHESFSNYEYETALHLLDSAITICPICVEPHFKKLIIYADLKKFDKADEELTTASVLSNGTSRVNWYAITLKSKKGLIDEALNDIQNEIDKDTSYRNVYYWLTFKVDMELQHKLYEQAYIDNLKAYQMNPKNKFALGSLTVHEIHINDNEKALKHLKEMTLETGVYDTARFYCDKAFIYYELKDYTNALDNVNACLVVAPKYARALIMRAMIRVLINPKDDGLTDANKAIELHPRYALYWNNRGFVKIIMGDYTNAIADLETAMLLSKTDPLPYNNLGYIYYKLGGLENLNKARFNYNKAVEIGGKDYKPYWIY